MVKYLCYIILAVTIMLTKPLMAQNYNSYYFSEKVKAENYYKNNDIENYYKHQKNIIDHFNKNKKKDINDSETCSIVFYAYVAFYYKDNNILHLKDAMSLIESNINWVRTFENKKILLNVYQLLINNLRNYGDIETIVSYNNKMIEFAESHINAELPNALFVAASTYSIMKIFEYNKPIYNRLYSMFERLDDFQKYHTVKQLIHFSFEDENYERVIELAEKHNILIDQTQDGIKDVVHNLINMSYSRLSRKVASQSISFSLKAEEVYERGSKWAESYNIMYLPLSLNEHACYLYQWEQYEKAIQLFHIYLGILESIGNKSQNNTIFVDKHKTIYIEDAQKALISIIYVEYINTKSPRDLKTLFQKYPNVISEIIESEKGKYFDEFIDVSLKARKKFNE